jgi:hypothetical protein
MNQPTRPGPRIVLIHAMHASMAPARAAFAAWPAARISDLLDDSLSTDLLHAGRMTPAIIDRFLALACYAKGAGAEGILFTCSAFGSAIEACQRALPIPILKPNEAALETALGAGPRVALLATFAPTIPALKQEIEDLAAAQRVPVQVTTAVVPGALEALAAGRPDEHDARIVASAAAADPCDALLLCQFSMARVAKRIAPVPGRTVLTTPDPAVAKLRRLVEARAAA